MKMVVLLLAVACWAFSPLRTAGFVYEDRVWMQAMTHETSLERRPLMYATWALQMRYTPSPQAFHAVNLALHLILALLVGVLAARLSLSSLSAWLATALVLLHPMTVESVAYLSARTELLAATGVVTACVLSVRARGWRWLLVYAVLGIAMLAKETAAVGFLLVPLTRWVTGHSWRWPAAFGIVTLAALVVAIGGWLRVVTGLGGAQGMDTDWLSWVLIQSTATVHLISLSVIPWFGGFTVDADYDFVSPTVRLVALLTLTILPILAWRLRKSQPILAFGLAWMLLALLPRLLVQTPRSYLNEHQFLTPFIGLVLAGASLTDRRTP